MVASGGVRLGVGALLLAQVFGSVARADSGPVVVLPVVVHVAEAASAPVVEERFVSERIERANTIFAPYGVRFEVQEVRALVATHAVVDTRDDRDALASAVTDGVLDCFVVKSLRDVDDPTQMRRGVHWHATTQPGVHYVILSSIAGLNVLAHELGHFLGNPAHSEVRGNLMSYLPGPDLPVLDAAQQTRLRRALRRYLRLRELLPLNER